MMAIEALSASPLVHRIGWTLLHSLWQSAVVALMLALLLRRLHRASAEARYLAACVALVMMAALPAATSGLLAPTPGPAEAVGSFAPARGPSTIGRAAGGVATVGPTRSWPHPAWMTPMGPHRALLSVLTFAWMTGVFVLSVRLLGGWLLVHRIGRRTPPLAGPCEAMLARLARTMRVRRAVLLLETSLVPVPMVIGGLRPVILLPVAAVTGLPPRQLEALLAHELAHICRYDYFTNLLQCAIEILLFYHPAAWWASQVIRAEREKCCDDLAVRACGDRLTYARALAAMEGLRGAPPRLCPAATGGPLLERIQRILNPEVESMNRLPIVSLGAALTLASLLLAGASTPLPSDTDSGESPKKENVRRERRLASGHPDRTPTVFVPTFRSTSFRRTVDLMLTELVQKEIEKRTPYKVVGNVEEADTILEGTVDFVDKNAKLENPFDLPRGLTAQVRTELHWFSNPPLESDRKSPPVIVDASVTFNPDVDETSQVAFVRTCHGLATRIIDVMQRPDRVAPAEGHRPGTSPGALPTPNDRPLSPLNRGLVPPPNSSAPAALLPNPPDTLRVTRIFPRNGGPEYSMVTRNAGGGVSITEIHGGVEIVTETGQDGLIAVSADNATIWHRADARAAGEGAVSPQREQLENAGQAMEVHLEGDVVIRQGTRNNVSIYEFFWRWPWLGGIGIR